MKSGPTVLFICLVALLTWGGCGVYTFNPRGSSSIETIAVEPFENETAEYGLADRMTELVVDEFIADGNIKVVSAAAAEVLLVGILKDYRRVVEKYDENDQVDEYKIVMDFEIALVNAEDQTDIWRENITQEGVYDAVEESEEIGQERAAGRLVEAVINKTTKSW